MQAFIKNGTVCLVEQSFSEPLEIFIERGLFVVSQHPCTEKEYNDAISYSRIHVNVKFLGCLYKEHVMGVLREMRRNVTVK